MAKLSLNFTEYELTYSKTVGMAVALRPHQRWLAVRLCQDLLEPIRACWGGYSVDVTSGARNRAIVDALLAKGYGVSNNTDHSFLDPQVNWMGVGAADIVSRSYFEFEKLMTFVYNLVRAGTIFPGQIIAYPYAGFFHVSNRKSLWFSEEACQYIPTQRDQMLISPELGKYVKWEN